MVESIGAEPPRTWMTNSTSFDLLTSSFWLFSVVFQKDSRGLLILGLRSFLFIWLNSNIPENFLTFWALFHPLTPSSPDSPQ